MSKYRKMQGLQVAYGFSGRIQDEMEAYQGFLEVAEEEGWQVWLLYEQFETQLRGLVEKGVVDAVVGDFISRRWVESLPKGLPVVHRGGSSLGEGISSVSLDMDQAVAVVQAHFREMGFMDCVYFSPTRGVALPWIRSMASLRDFLQQGECVGVFCASDYLARKAIHCAVELGRKIPEHVGVVGMGDRRLDRLLAEMEISSLVIPHRVLGRQAARLLRERLAGEAPREWKVSPGVLLSRQSSLRRRQTPGLRERLEDWLMPVLADPPPVEAWARRMGMSRRSFENAFMKENGCTPYVYFMQMRTREAQRLLRESEWTVSRVGLAVGIPDPPRFSAFFKKQTGQTPSQWRNRLD